MKNPLLSLALAAVSAAGTLSRPADWSPSLRRLYILAPGAAIGAISVVAVQKGTRKGRELAAASTVDLVTPFTAAGEDGAAGEATAPSYLRAAGSAPRTPAIALAGMAALVGVTVSGVLALTLALDEQVEKWLVRRGAARPRWVMAAAAAASSLLLDYALDGATDSGDSGKSKG
ncbi:hypothetical protein MUK71_14395 [Arthrobacter zhangbolii]|uniref:Uncharacterized protein n=1 Tax=Arthrobacter zhangbolii TaxID=2886936 RepID=A0A9X1M7V7_9MICC|nr:hypothetical protein [Arthrobacter zhangbolii]MCC3272385.1 hypothetical protein [Arthrobacter zhangbolii]UON91753.1 hypothetical protein MUK71_14395 [Arthrobacter zhangbolii]